MFAKTLDCGKIKYFDEDTVYEAVEMLKCCEFDFQPQICEYFDNCGDLGKSPDAALNGLAFLFINFPENVRIEIRLFESAHTLENLRRSLLQRNSRMPFKTMVATTQYKQLIKEPESFDARQLEIVSAE